MPLVPLGSSHVWQCGICRESRFSGWRAELMSGRAEWQASQDGPAPPLAQGGYGQQPQQWQQPNYGPQQGMQRELSLEKGCVELTRRAEQP